MNLYVASPVNSKLMPPPQRPSVGGIYFHHFYLSIQILTILVLILMLHNILRAKLSKSVNSLLLMNVFSLIYMFGYVLEHTSTDLNVICTCIKVEYFGQYGITIAVLWFFDIFFERKCRKWIYLPVTLLTGLCVLCVFTMERHTLFYNSILLKDYGSYALVISKPGIMYKLFYFMVLLIFARIELLGLKKFRHGEPLEKHKNLLIVTSPLYPLAAILIKWTGLSTEYDLMALGILGFIGSLTIAIIKYSYFDTIRSDTECDPLTGVSSRDFFENRIEMYIKDNVSGSLFMLDLDNFKEINDTYGHLEGDNVLISLADTLKDVAKDKYSITRIGGDEFSLYLPKIVGEHELAHIADAIIANFKEEQKKKELRCCCSCSIGIAVYNGVSDVSFIRLYENADKALYLAKKSGKGKWKIF